MNELSHFDHRRNPEEPELVDIYNFKTPDLKYFDPSVPTKVAVHGWMTDGAGVFGLRQGNPQCGTSAN